MPIGMLGTDMSFDKSFTLPHIVLFEVVVENRDFSFCLDRLEPREVPLSATIAIVERVLALKRHHLLATVEVKTGRWSLLNGVLLGPLTKCGFRSVLQVFVVAFNVEIHLAVVILFSTEA